MRGIWPVGPFKWKYSQELAISFLIKEVMYVHTHIYYVCSKFSNANNTKMTFFSTYIIRYQCDSAQVSQV